MNILEEAKKVLHAEALAIEIAKDRLDQNFEKAVNFVMSIDSLHGRRLVITGLGKSGHIGAKLASTFSSTGTPAVFLHPSEALHGDFGLLTPGDILLALAHGGETREVLMVTRYAKQKQIPVISISGNIHSSLAKESDVALFTWVEKEADHLDLAPTNSSTTTLALGDALAVVLMKKRGLNHEDFAKLHPGGSLGRRLAYVWEKMRPLSDLVFISPLDGFQDILNAVGYQNFGIVPVRSPSDGKLLGCVTDGDLRRALIKHKAQALELKAQDLMNQTPKTIHPEERAQDGLRIMQEARITSLFVTKGSELLGLFRLHDIHQA